MRHQRCHTCVRRGGTRRRAGDAAARASGRVVPRGSHMVFTDTSRRAPNRADSGLNRPYRPKRPIQAEIQKKKTQNAPFDLILTLLQPSFTQNAKTPLLTFRLTHFVSVLSASLPLCLYFVSLSASLPLFRLPCCINSFFLQLSLTHY